MATTQSAAIAHIIINLPSGAIAGDDGRDFLRGGRGEDVIYGGGGRDTFVFQRDAIGEGVDTIKDFNKYKDTLDIRDLLTNYDPMTDMLEDFVKADRSRGKTTISVDMDGQGTDASFTAFAIIQGSRVDLQDLVNGGVLLTA